MRNAVGRTARRLLGSVVAVGAIFVVLASPAGADGVGPTNFRSVIDSVTPRADGVKIEVVGEDSFLQVSAVHGATVEIPGYDGEPYLRITRDGTVERNRNSAATYLNNSRSGQVALPPEIGSGKAPDWERLATDGTVAWHDHRIHYMASGSPNVGDGGLVQEWQVPMTVNGQEVQVSGSLLHAGNTFPWAALVLGVAALGAALVLRRHGQRWATPLVVGAGALALGLSASVAWMNPPGSGASWLPIVLPLLAIFAGLATRLVPAEVPPMVRLAPLLAAVACLVGWAIPLIGVLWKPNIPSALPGELVRFGFALAVGVAVGAVVAVLAWPEPSPSRSAAPDF